MLIIVPHQRLKLHLLAADKTLDHSVFFLRIKLLIEIDRLLLGIIQESKPNCW